MLRVPEERIERYRAKRFPGLAQREESVMSNSKDHRETSDRVSASLRAAALIAFIAVLGLVVVSFESPWVLVAPDQALARTAGSAAAAAAEPAPSAADYFPSHFSAPKAVADEPVQAF
jgi:hypothetical protein